MGKIRVKTLGIEEAEKEQKKEDKKRKEAKKLVKGAHGGERVVAVGPSEEELARLPSPDGEATGGQAKIEVSQGEKVPQVPQGEIPRDTRDTRTPRDTHPRERGRRYKQALVAVDRTKRYPLAEALELLRKVSASWRIDGTVELHVNTTEKGLSGNVNLPHGTGKQIRVAIATDELIGKIEKNKIDFDVLLAAPDMMAKLAKVAKILGPRGLMPNPKNGTITNDPGKLALSLSKGNQLRFKTETAPIIHLSVGKLSMTDNQLTDNIQAVLSAIGNGKIKSVTLKSTMSPGIRIDFSTLS